MHACRVHQDLVAFADKSGHVGLVASLGSDDLEDKDIWLRRRAYLDLVRRPKFDGHSDNVSWLKRYGDLFRKEHKPVRARPIPPPKQDQIQQIVKTKIVSEWSERHDPRVPMWIRYSNHILETNLIRTCSENLPLSWTFNLKNAKCLELPPHDGPVWITSSPFLPSGSALLTKGLHLIVNPFSERKMGDDFNPLAQRDMALKPHLRKPALPLACANVGHPAVYLVFTAKTSIIADARCNVPVQSELSSVYTEGTLYLEACETPAYGAISVSNTKIYLWDARQSLKPVDEAQHKISKVAGFDYSGKVVSLWGTQHLDNSMFYLSGDWSLQKYFDVFEPAIFRARQFEEEQKHAGHFIFDQDSDSDSSKDSGKGELKKVNESGYDSNMGENDMEHEKDGLDLGSDSSRSNIDSEGGSSKVSESESQTGNKNYGSGRSDGSRKSRTSQSSSSAGVFGLRPSDPGKPNEDSQRTRNTFFSSDEDSGDESIGSLKSFASATDVGERRTRITLKDEFRDQLVQQKSEKILQRCLVYPDIHNGLPGNVLPITGGYLSNMLDLILVDSELNFQWCSPAVSELERIIVGPKLACD